MKKHPYDAGEAPVGAANISVELAHGIHNGWVVGAISALVLLVGAVAGLATGDGMGFVINLLAAVACAGLAYGVYRRISFGIEARNRAAPDPSKKHL